MRKMMMLIGLLSLNITAAWSTGKPGYSEKVILSPDGHMQFKIAAMQNKLMYSVIFNKVPVIEHSLLQLSVDGKDITRGAKIEGIENYRVNEAYPWYGVHAVASDHCNGMKIRLRDPQNKSAYTLEVRAYNDGVAFRWMVPGGPDDHRIPDESTEFILPRGSISWYHDLRMHYEGVYAKKNIDTVQTGEWAAAPVTAELPGKAGYVSITEANLINYSGVALQSNGKHGFVLRLAHHQPVSYPYELRYSKEDVEKSMQTAVITGAITTPWRVVMVGADLNAMVNNDMVHNLCPPPDKKLFPQGIHTAWIKPGRAVWKYLDGGGPGTPENMKRFSAMAKELGFEYNILEGYWSEWKDDSLKELVDYSKRQGVGIWVWKHSKELRNPEAGRRFFQHCHDMGITGVKIDFFDSEAKSVIDLYEDILREAASFHLLLDFHGANKPTGLERTWPNELNVEAVKGMESRSLEDRATHTVTLPFTRYLAGDADYTPVHFGERRCNTTWANQVASAVIIDGRLLTYAADPENMLANPCVKMIKSIPPAVWDETIVLPPSGIGEVAVYARRKGNTWFLAVMNGKKPKTIRVPLSFLKDNHYHAVVIRDQKDDPASVKIEEKDYTEKDSISMKLAEGGGLVARFEKE